MKRTHWILALLALELVGCAGMRIAVPRMRPAEVNLAGYRRVALGDIDGTDGSRLVNELTSAMVATERFDVLERSELEKILNEQDLGMSGRVSDDTVASIGHLIGSAAIIVGRIEHRDYGEKVSEREVTCSTEEPGKTRTCTEYRRHAEAWMQATLKVIDTESGRVLAAKTLNARRSANAKQTDAPPPPLNRAEPLFAQCRTELVQNFMKVIAPYEERVWVVLAEDDAVPELAQGNNFAKIGNWGRARGAYERALATVKTNPDSEPEQRAKVLFNLGVAHGYTGEYARGISYLEEAYSLDPESETERQIEIIRRFERDDAELAEQQRGHYDAGL